jgi:NHL repeat
MRLVGLGGLCALLPWALCSCGSGGASAGPMDASMDAPDVEAGAFDAPKDVAEADTPADSPMDAPPDARISSTCDNTGLLAGCVVGACTLSATGKPLPDGVVLTVTQKAVPSDLNGDTLGSVLCSIDVPADAGIQTVANLNLSIGLSAAADANAVLFQYVSPQLSREVPTSQPSGNAVVGLVTAPGDFGATDRPEPWSLQADLGLDMSSSADQPSLLRNLSSQAMSGAFYDGTHLFVCNGARLLVYNGIPKNPSVKPDLVLGQADLNTVSAQTTSSLMANTGCGGLWSDGTRLVAATGNRILIWNALPTQNAAPADLVLGQPDFSSNKANNGGVRSTTLSSVASVDSDGQRLVAADRLNNRVLVWNTFPTAIDQPADIVIGQPDFTSNAASNGATHIYQPWGTQLAGQGLFFTGMFDPGFVHVATTTVNNPATNFTVLPLSPSLQPTPNVLYWAGRIAKTPNGGVAVRDAYLHRIAMLKSLPTGPSRIDFVLGEPDLNRVVSGPVTASVVATAADYGLGGGSVLLIPHENRLLIFDSAPTFNFEPASRVLGQAGFTTSAQVDYRGISASTLAGPADVAVANGIVAVADRNNNRILLFKTSDVAAYKQAAYVVLGQPDGASYVPNGDQQTPTGDRVSGPGGIALDGTHLIVADTENHRVLIWNSMPTASGQAADLVLGQATFSDHRPNHGRGDTNGDGYSDANANGFFYPTGVASDGTHLFVADRLNNRVLVWNTFPTANDKAADAVIGQADFTTSVSNRGSGAFAYVANGLNLPTGLALVGTTLWIADTENNRVVRWDDATSAPTPGAFVGQANGTTVANPNYQPPAAATNVGFPTSNATTSGSVLRPRGIAIAAGRLFVTETDSSRVHMFDATTYAPLGELGQSSDTAGTANAVGVNASSLASPLGVAATSSTLWVADSANNRLLGYDLTTAPATGAAATLVLGQPTPVSNGFNETSTAAAGTTSQPHGLALANGKLYIADTSNNRVLVLTTPVMAGQMPSSVYGQPDLSLALPNSGGSPSATTLSGPQGVFADSARVIVADTSNNRVLVYDANATTGAATLVLGQTNFTTAAPNAGGATASVLQGPTSAYSNGTSLWVADTGNHRVLVWNTFPTSNGQPADIVIGQASMSGMLSNQGNAAASASSLSFPMGITVANGITYIADSGNNRVVRFSTAPTSSGANADGVLGQADLSSRIAAVTATDLAHLAGPVALAYDSENLYVVDRDLGRVLQYTLSSLMSSSPASVSIGSAGGLSLSTPEGIAVERTPFFTSRLYVADTGHNQVGVVQSVSRLLSQ